MKRLAALAVPLAAALVLAHGAKPSGADFVASSAHAKTTFATATAFNSVAVTLSNPGTPLRGTVPVAAVATSDEPLAGVQVQRSPAGAGTWTDVCTDTGTPFSCDWATTGVADGLYDLRAIATDAAGYSQTSAVVTGRRVDNTAPSASIADPGVVTGTRTITVSSADAGSGVASVAMEYKAAAASGWTALCTDATSAYQCSWSTAALPDGLYDLRATAVDNAGNATTTTLAGRRVDNTAPTVAVVEDGTPRRGSATLVSTGGDGNGSGVASVTMEIQVMGAWTTICTDPTAAYSCTGDTTQVPDGIYPLRAIATDNAGFSTTSATVNTRIDNTAPSSATITDPGSPISGTKALAGTAADAGSGIASLRFEYRSGGAWTTACTDSVAPYTTCSWNTTGVPDGVYEVRSVATDLAGWTTASAAVAARVVDNVAPTVSVTDPGALLRATVTVSATAADAGAGVTNVAIQYARTGTSTWTTICTDASSSYSCAWNTAGVTDGSYGLRAIATDNANRTTTSAVVASRAVNNASPAATDVQGANVGTAGTMNPGDTITFAYSQTIKKTSISSAWTGTTLNLTVRVTDGGASDRLDFYNQANTARINLTGSGTAFDTKADHVAAAGARFAATATQSGGTITVTLGARAGTVKTGVASTAPMTWLPSTSATNASNLAVLGLTATESGAADSDF